MNYKLLVLDLDDTLLSTDLTISEENTKAIKEAKKKGVHVVLCSGRPMKSMMPYAKMLDVHSEEDYIVSYNGAVINNFEGERILYNVIDGDGLQGLIDTGRKHKIDVQLYAEDLTVEKYTERTKMYEGLTGFPATMVDQLEDVETSIKVLFNHEAGEKLENLRLELLEKFSDIYNIFYSKPFYVEVLNNKASKGLAVEYIGKKLGIKREEIIAMGDGFNDVSMIEYAGLGVAVSNAPKGVQDIADYVTTNDHNNSAVMEVFNKYIK